MLEAERALAQAARRRHRPAPTAAASPPPASPTRSTRRRCSSEARRWQPVSRSSGARRAGRRGRARCASTRATSQDIMDTAAMLVTRRALELVLADLDRVAAACAGLAAHRATPMAGGRCCSRRCRRLSASRRPGGSWRFSTPLAASRIGGGRARGAARRRRRHARCARRPGAEVSRVRARARSRRGDLPWHTNRVRIAELGGALGDGRGVLAKSRSTSLLLSQTEIGEVQESGNGRLLRDAAQAEPGRSDATRAAPRSSRALASRRVTRRPSTSGRRSVASRVGGALRCAGDDGRRRCCALAASEGLEVDTPRMLANLDSRADSSSTEQLCAPAHRAARDGLRRARSCRRPLRARRRRPLSEEWRGLDTGLTPTEIARGCSTRRRHSARRARSSTGRSHGTIPIRKVKWEAL